MQSKELIEIYNQLKDLIDKYKKHFSDIRELPGRYSLWNVGEFEVLGKKRKEIYFCGIIIQSNYVGFYYMPVYTNDELKVYFSPELLKLLKGKSCFHIKKLDSELLSDIDKALKLGVKLYKDNNWIN